MKPKLLVILGPTATGKTDLGLTLAEILNGELVACDSRQVYTGLDIGTGKEPGKDSKFKKAQGYWIIDGIKVWLYDVANPKHRYTAWNYANQASHLINQISRENKLPIVVGGSGLYLRSLLRGLDESSNSGIIDEVKLELEKLSLTELQEKLQNLSPAFFKALNNSERNNKRRLVRKIELLSSPSPIHSELKLNGLENSHDVLKVGISCSKSILNQRIDIRVDKRINQGMIEEAKRLNKQGLTFSRMRELGLEYGLLADFLDSKIHSIEQLSTILKIKIHQYAKRQITWFKKEKDVIWFDITDSDYPLMVEKVVRDWYNA